MYKKLSAALLVGLMSVAGIASAAPAPKVNVCHHTNSAKNPIVLISVSSNSLDAHLSHGDQIVSSDTTDCSNVGGGDGDQCGLPGLPECVPVCPGPACIPL